MEPRLSDAAAPRWRGFALVRGARVVEALIAAFGRRRGVDVPHNDSARSEVGTVGARCLGRPAGHDVTPPGVLDRPRRRASGGSGAAGTYSGRARRIGSRSVESTIGDARASNGAHSAPARRGLRGAICHASGTAPRTRRPRCKGIDRVVAETTQPGGQEACARARTPCGAHGRVGLALRASASRREPPLAGEDLRSPRAWANAMAARRRGAYASGPPRQRMRGNGFARVFDRPRRFDLRDVATGHRHIGRASVGQSRSRSGPGHDRDADAGDVKRNATMVVDGTPTSVAAALSCPAPRVRGPTFAGVARRYAVGRPGADGRGPRRVRVQDARPQGCGSDPP